MNRREQAGAGGKKRPAVGRPSKLGPDGKQALIDLIAQDRYATVGDITRRLAQRTGVKLHPLTVGKMIKGDGIRRQKPDRYHHPKPGPRYGYTERHRGSSTQGAYPTSLTDAEWDRVREIFDPPGRPGRPPTHDRRQVLDACLYVVRTGCSWRMLPKEFPDWDNVYKTFRRWHREGLLEQLHDRLLTYWRRQMNRHASPRTAAIDSQSTRHSPQGGSAGYDANKKNQRPKAPWGGGLRKRWVVERTHAWHERFRRLIMHHDRLPEVGAAWTWLANARLMLNRLFR